MTAPDSYLEDLLARYAVLMGRKRRKTLTDDQAAELKHVGQPVLLRAGVFYLGIMFLGVGTFSFVLTASEAFTEPQMRFAVVVGSMLMAMGVLHVIEGTLRRILVKRYRESRKQ